ncbi:MAG: GNAT family N-acetyltransferase [Bacilli bacterium]|nr:GNAT family N-acetyltransferase [Bacilli bacterium]
MELRFEEVNRDNLEIAVKVQNEIFPLENGRDNFIEGIQNNPYRKEMINFITYTDEEPVGVVGLYSYNEYPNDAWLSWFGVLDKYRNRGYGSLMFNFFEDLAKKKGYTAVRVYTSAEFEDAIKLYQNKGMISERYSNELECSEINEETIIFSKSLTNKKIDLWNNKFLELTAQIEKEK